MVNTDNIRDVVGNELVIISVNFIDCLLGSSLKKSSNYMILYPQEIRSIS